MRKSGRQYLDSYLVSLFIVYLYHFCSRGFNDVEHEGLVCQLKNIIWLFSLPKPTHFNKSLMSKSLIFFFWVFIAARGKSSVTESLQWVSLFNLESETTTFPVRNDQGIRYTVLWLTPGKALHHLRETIRPFLEEKETFNGKKGSFQNRIYFCLNLSLPSAQMV